MEEVLELIVSDDKGVVDKNNTGKICRQMGKKKVIVPEDIRKADPSAPEFVYKAVDNYTFYAVKSIPLPSGAEPIQVMLSMPLGGQNNGIFRYPRIGERVLVVCHGNKYYLLAYLPSKEGDCNDFEFSASEVVEKVGDTYAVVDIDENTTLCDAEAEILRYRKRSNFRSKNGNDVNCSEIGFYREVSEFPSDRDDIELPPTECSRTYEYLENGDYKKVTFVAGEEPSAAIKNDKDTKVTKYPLIDNLKIQSAGNISTTSQNANETNAQRILIQSTFLSGENVKHASTILDKDLVVMGDVQSDSKIVAEYNYRAGIGKGGDKKAKEKAEKSMTDNMIKIQARHNKMVMPNKSNLSSLGKGDICLNADGNITLNARGAITLKVGANKIVIDKSGVKISTGTGLGLMPSPFDGTLSITNDGKVSIGGNSFSASMEEAFALSDAMGGGVSSSLGAVDLTGVEVGLSSMTTANHMYKTGNWLFSKALELMAKVTNQGRSGDVAGMAKAYEVLAKIQGYAGGVAGTAVGAMKRSHNVNMNGDTFNFNNTMLVPIIYNIIWGILGAVKSSLMSLRETKDALHYDKTDGYYSKLHQDDGIYNSSVDKINRLYELDLGFTITQMALIVAVKTAMIIMQRENMFHFSTFKLGCDASASLEAKDYYQNTINAEEVVSLAAGLQVANYADIGKTDSSKVTGVTIDENKVSPELSKDTYRQVGANMTSKIAGQQILTYNDKTFATWDNAIKKGKFTEMFDKYNSNGKVPVNTAGIAIAALPTLVVTSVVCGINEGFAQNCIADEQKEVVKELGDL
ncbi:MAG: hypothetical protein MJ250_05735 [Alphaproteobacteria bacterium]|nr:hypothetical protein [Alphaproteobacteria bacterium]